MPDFLRPMVYPVLLTCIVGSLWMLASSAGREDEADRAVNERIRRLHIHYSNLARSNDPGRDDRYAELDQN